MVGVRLRELVTDADRETVAHLRRGPGQERYLNSMRSIFEEAVEDAAGMPRMWAVHDARSDEIVGFTMISDNIPEPRDEDHVGPYFLWKLLIDESQQRRGYGRATIDAVVAYVRTRPNAEVLFTSCADGPGSPRPFYLGYGFTDTGRVMWGENLLVLDLGRRE